MFRLIKDKITNTQVFEVYYTDHRKPTLDSNVVASLTRSIDNDYLELKVFWFHMDPDERKVIVKWVLGEIESNYLFPFSKDCVEKIDEGHWKVKLKG